MKNELQLAGVGNLPVPMDDPWGQQGALGPAQRNPGFGKVQRSLRGRYLLAVVLATVCAVTGGAVGFMSQHQMYRSNGLIEIRPTIPSFDKIEQIMPQYERYVKSQVALLGSHRVMQEAMQNPDWQANYASKRYSLGEFSKALDIDWVTGSTLIQVGFTDTDPSVGPVAVKAVIEAYKAIYGEVDSRDNREKLRILDDRKTAVTNSLKAKRELILSLAQEYGSDDLTEYHNATQTELVKLESSLNQAIMAREGAEAALGTKASATRPAMTAAQQQLTFMDIARIDPAMRNYLAQKSDLEYRLQRLERTMGERSRAVLDAKADLEAFNQRLMTYADDFRRANAIQYGGAAGTDSTTMSPAALDQLRVREDQLRRLVEKQRAMAQAIGQRRLQIQQLKMEVEQLRENQDEFNKRADELTVESQMRGKMNFLSYGDPPVGPAVDKRKQMGAIGFVGGALLPVVLLMMIGLFDPRYRYSDDAGQELSGLTLLGILPNLPHLLTDPEQAGVAAHCVHQIRTMLQINAQSEDRRVFAITSASPGDGKTSLALALGLSFAASGSRTLLVDCDLVGAGLTARLNVKSDTGILEAASGRGVLEHVNTTDIAGLSILPVGNADAHHAGMLSPQSLRRLCMEARKHFDVIIIDTGPILGSIEATPVASAVDSVILTVARGQQRPLVEKALSHLLVIGARLAGVVFNKAEARDFERSVSSMSLRAMNSAPGAGGAKLRTQTGRPENPGEYGPVAQAVAKSFKPSNGNDRT